MGFRLRSVCRLLGLLLAVFVCCLDAAAQGRIVYIRQVATVSGNTAIRLIDPDGNTATYVKNPASGVSYFDPVLSPDGKKVLFVSNPTSTAWFIRIINTDGTGETNLVSGTDELRYPSFSPDGSKIVFSKRGGGKNYIYIMNADGSNQTRISPVSVTTDENSPSFSPDGTKVLFTNGDIFEMNTDGTGRVNLTNTSTNLEENPTYSPSGQSIAFDAHTQNTNSASLGIGTINRNGSGYTMLGLGGAHPRFSPDGTRLCYSANANIYTATPNGTAIAQVTTDGNTNIGQSIFNVSPAWGNYADTDGDGDPDNTDCAPTNAAVHHGATEICNGIDDNCDGQIDEGFGPASKKYFVKPGGTGDGSSWAAATGNLQWAIDHAACAGDSVFVMKGSYKPAAGQSFVLREGVKLYGHFAGVENTVKDRRLSGTDTTVLRGNGASVINNDNNGLTAATLLDGFIITGGSGAQGGGMRNLSASPTVQNCYFVGNSATEGGAIYAYLSTLSLNNCVFAGNSSATGAALRSVLGSFDINNSTFTGNTGSNSIITVNGSVNLQNSIVWGNAGGITTGGLGGATIAYSNVQGGVAPGTGNISQDPLFANASSPAGADGILGTVDDGLRLGCGSPAKNAGSNVLVPMGLTTDIIGFSRIRNTTVDMGAYEAAGGGSTKLFVTASGSGRQDGSSWANAFADLQTAINEGCVNDSVFVKGGIYSPIPGRSIAMKEGVKTYGHFAGTETSLAQRNMSSTDTTFLQGIPFLQGYPLIENTANAGITRAAVLDGFTLRNNFGTFGGGMMLTEASPTVRNCVFENLSGETISNAIFINRQSASGPALFENCIIRKNLPDPLFVGLTSAVDVWGASPVFNRCVFDGNFNEFSYGEALVSSSDSHPLVVNSIFVNHQTPVYCVADATFVNCTFAKNQLVALVPNYGPIYKVTFNNCVLWGNTQVFDPYSYDEPFRIPKPNYCIAPDFGANPGVGNINADPLYVNINDPDGPDNIWGTADDGLRLQCNSPAINSGNNDSLPAGLTTDFAGTPRIQNGAVDRGAYENTALPFTMLAPANDSALQFQVGTMSYGTCGNLIATLNATGANPLKELTMVKVWKESVQSDFVKRHYEITPRLDTATATARITLYFTQQEFNDYNSGNAVKLPTGPADAAGKANLVIEKRPGRSSNGTGLPTTYTGVPVVINPADADIVWNAAASRWEVSFDVTGFSGFFVKAASAGALPVRWLTVRGSLTAGKQAFISWNVAETNVASYTVEKSTDGAGFAPITTVAGKGDGANSYGYTEPVALTRVSFYRIRQTDRYGRGSYSTIIRLDPSVAATTALTVYPNPFATGFTVTSPVAQGAQLLDAQGKLVMKIHLLAGTNVINADKISSGIYLLKTADGFTQKLIKQ